tara:strand:+ start:373 stop:627 length:255 start_codon:yes stop_codon:yes gene_type:complete
MTFTETTEYDRIEVVGQYKHVQIRKAEVVKKDGKEIARTFVRHSVAPHQDISGEPAEVQAICNAAWTDEIKAAWKTYQESESLE